MGCDIHVHVEIMFQDDPRWHHYNAPCVDRDYVLFERIAGVRGDKRNAIVKPRGIPDDMSRVTAYDYARWGIDAHTPGWLTAEEFMQLSYWYDLTPGHGRSLHWQFGYLFGDMYDAFKSGAVSRRLKGIADVRIVFWFDN